MKWKIENTGDTNNSAEILLILTVTIIVVGLIWSRPLTFILSGFIGIYALLTWQYSKRIGKGLELVNQKRTIRLFEGEKANLDMKLCNDAFISYLNGKLIFFMNEKIENEINFMHKRMGRNQYTFSFFLAQKKTANFKFPFEARQRGIARLENIQITFPHMFNFQKVYLKFNERYQTEIIVYPKLELVKGIEEIPSYLLGEQQSRFSPFEDMVLTKGTRDYTSSDPFHKIHWKATARKQELQTKEFEPVKNLSWSIIINIAKVSPLGNLYCNDRMEHFLSQAAYISWSLIEQGFPVEVYINSAVINRQPIHFPMGEGREHLKNILEFLARFDENAPMLPMNSIYRLWDSNSSGSSFIILLGEVEENVHSYYKKWTNRQTQMLHVRDGANGAYIVPLQKDGKIYEQAK